MHKLLAAGAQDYESRLGEPGVRRTRLALRGFGVVAGLYSVLGGLLTILGWAIENQRLKDWIASGITMKPNAALAQSLAGAALVLVAALPSIRPARVVASCFAGAVALIGLATLSEHLVGWDLGIDTLLWSEPVGVIATAAPCRMGPPASSSYLLLGAAILFIQTPRAWAPGAASILGTIVFAIASLSVLGFAYGVDQLFALAAFTGIAFQTSSMLLLLSMGVIALCPERGVASILLNPGPGGAIARRLVPAGLLVPPIVGFIALSFDRRSLADSSFVLALFTLGMMLIFGLIALASAARIARSSAALRLSERLRRRILGVVPAAVYVIDLATGSVVFSNREPASTPAGDNPDIHPDDLPRLKEHVRSVSLLGDADAIECEFRARDASGGWRWYLGRHAVLDRDASGTPRSVIGTATDITARKTAEAELARHQTRLEELVEQRTEELSQSLRRLGESERLAALGTLAAGLGHDMANLLLPVRARLESLSLTSPGADAKADITAMSQALDHLSALSAGMRLMALDPEREAASTAAVNLAAWWTEAQGVLNAILPRSVRLAGDIPQGLGIQMPRHQLMQIVFNLVQNAGEALAGREAGLVSVAAHAVTIDSRPFVEIVVADNGPGMSAQVRARCFEPYFSTKGRSISTGMGLSLVRGRVEANQGTIRVESEPGAGARFTLSLPAAIPVGIPGRPAHLRRSTLSVQDDRTAGIASLILDRLSFAVHAAPADHAPEGELWVVQNPSQDAVDAFLTGDQSRRVFALGGVRPEPANGHPRTPPADPSRIVVLPLRPTPSELRNALRHSVGAEPAPAS